MFQSKKRKRKNTKGESRNSVILVYLCIKIQIVNTSIEQEIEAEEREKRRVERQQKLDAEQRASARVAAFEVTQPPALLIRMF